MTPRRKPAKTTIVDIAAACGVSVATVSRILNGKPDVAEDTRARVLQVMDDLGFAPQSAWRQIRSGRTRLIAMHVPEEFNPPNFRVIMAAALGVEEAGYSINIITRPLSEPELLGIFRGRQADGMILLEILADDRRASVLRDHGYPFVMVGHCADNTGLSFVDIDIDDAIQTALGHLMQLGHRSIALATLDPVFQDKRYGYATWVLECYERACRRLGLVALSAVAAPTAEAMADAASRLIADHPEITAFVTPQEQSAVGVLKLAQRSGMRIPDDLSLVATMEESLRELATPALTTIAFPSDELGTVAARILIDRLEGGATEPDQVLLRPRLVEGGSSGRPRARVRAGRVADRTGAPDTPSGQAVAR